VRAGSGGLTPRELDILGAWWHEGSVVGAAQLVNVSEQTAKNVLHTARLRAHVATNLALARLFLDDLPSLKAIRNRPVVIEEPLERRRRVAREYLQTHPEQAEKNRVRAREYARKVRANDPAQLRLTSMYERLVKLYGSVCQICGRPPEPGRRLSIDHDHATDEIRGLLCRGCNYGIGCLKDSVPLLESAIAYLRRDNHTGIPFSEAVGE
jgi:hypothetical protein